MLRFLQVPRGFESSIHLPSCCVLETIEWRFHDVSLASAHFQRPQNWVLGPWRIVSASPTQEAYHQQQPCVLLQVLGSDEPIDPAQYDCVGQFLGAQAAAKKVSEYVGNRFIHEVWQLLSPVLLASLRPACAS